MKLSYDRSATEEAVDCVDTNIGTLSWKTWSTSPTVQLPHGMIEVDPLTTPGIGDKYLADKIHAFFTEGFSLMPVSRSPGPELEENASEFDHDLELATPYHYAVLLEDSGIEAEYTTTERAALFRFLYPEDSQPTILTYLAGDARVEVGLNGALAGSQVFRGVRVYFHLAFSQEPQTTTIEESDSPQVQHLGWHRMKPTVTIKTAFSQRATGELHVRAAFSYISAEQARRNLESELPDWDFDRARIAARSAWNELLGRIRVEGGTEAQKRIFYTAIYHDVQRMKNTTEEGRYYSGFDGGVHEPGDHDFYNVDQPWDTYRCARPLQFIIEPERVDAMLASYVRMSEQLGWSPITPHTDGERATMVGRHITATVADGYAKGYHESDLERAYKRLRASGLTRAMSHGQRARRLSLTASTTSTATSRRGQSAMMPKSRTQMPGEIACRA